MGVIFGVTTSIIKLETVTEYEETTVLMLCSRLEMQPFVQISSEMSIQNN